MNKRHDFLVSTIGAYPEEFQAHWMINFLANYMPILIIGATVVQFVLYLLYNRFLHPFKDLIQDEDNVTFYVEMKSLTSQNDK